MTVKGSSQLILNLSSTLQVESLSADDFVLKFASVPAIGSTYDLIKVKSSLNDEMLSKYKNNFTLVYPPVEALNISSSDVREKVLANEPYDSLMPLKAYEILKQVNISKFKELTFEDRIYCELNCNGLYGSKNACKLVYASNFEMFKTWNEDLLHRILPRIYQIILEINRRFMAEVWNLYPGQWDRINKLSLIGDNHVRMANLSVVGSHKVNGVSALHSDIIKRSVFKDFYLDTPEKFTNVTNGIAHRRWLHQSNPRLAALLDECIGHDWYKDASNLKKFAKFADDEKVLERLEQIKLENKKDFANAIYKKQGVIIDPNTRFDVHVKRLHEYKRQLLNVLKIVHLYNLLKENPDYDLTPQTFIFGAKAAPGYYHAKEIIELINKISEDINNNPAIKKKLNVVFIEDYCVTLAEKLMPASEISEQISLAGKEASGTGNMKLMMNGAITIGTLDGANVEIHEAVGDDNMFLFGMRTEEVNSLRSRGYDPMSFYNNNEDIRKILDFISRGINGQNFSDISGTIMHHDPYMVLADFADYRRAQQKMVETFKDKKKWNQMMLSNIANSGRFAADRAINEYAKDIWNAQKI